jgi:hypothetical protein
MSTRNETINVPRVIDNEESIIFLSFGKKIDIKAIDGEI